MRRCWFLFCILLVAPFAPANGETEESALSPKQRRHWAYQPVRRPSVPKLESDRVRTPIDAFVLNRLLKSQLRFAPDAERRVLIRRLKFDLLGLPPTPAETEAFINDKRPDAYERLVESLLASPHYGEAWGRMWLDLVRFSETAGFNADPARPLAYKYRDYVIRAFNTNKPYSRFVAEQLAGDELYPNRVEALVATGYNRMWPDESNASDVLLARQDALNDLTANVGSVFLGSSFGCAQCHDHKFDPLLQSDFYRLQAFFTGIVLKDKVAVGTKFQLGAYRKKYNAWLDRSKSVRAELHRLMTAAKQKAGAIRRRKFPPKVLRAIDTAPEERTAMQWQLVFWSERQIKLKNQEVTKHLKKADRKRVAELRRQLKELSKKKPQPPRLADVMATVELPSGPAKAYLLAGGSYNQPEREVQPGFPVVTLDPKAKPFVNAAIESPRTGTSGRRSSLVKWLLDARNPLTARVMVNRIWQGHLGRGLVSNANDFGTRTPKPTHPELLDWLAAEFVRSGWDVKHMHRLIVMSSVYRQAPYVESDGESPFASAIRIDPANKLYWHFPRRRLTSERIRDSLLFIGGQLTTKMYGSGVKPKLPPKFSARHAWKPSKRAFDRNRRSVYIYAKRNLPYPLMKAFDFPDMHESCAKRAQTTIAPQALMLLNGELSLEAARSFAERLLADGSPAELPKLIRRAYRAAYGRFPEKNEQAAAVAFVRQQESLIRKSGDSKQAPARQRAIVDFCHALLNSNEFLFVE